MRIKVRSFAGFRNILGKQIDVHLAEAATVEDLLNALRESHPAIGPNLFAEAGLREDVNIFVSGKNITALQSLGTVLNDGDEVALFPAAIGG
jgi:sulfur-carrier protein